VREQFIDWKPSSATVILLAEILHVLDEFREQGYKLTLRQLYYQLVSRDVVPNNVKSYNRLGNVVSKGRLRGAIDWSDIEDRVRVPSENSHWSSPAEILYAAADGFYMDRWVGQSNYVEVWCEKDAVSNIIQPVCEKYDVLFMANRGYSSQTAMYDASQRFKKAFENKKDLHLIYLGDHDPSGIDMTRDIAKRLGLFFTKDEDRMINFVDRIALTMDQIEQYSPPENPAKVTDSRYESYVAKYGEFSWELDALEPSVLAEVVEDAIFQYLDHVEFDKVVEEEKQHKEQIKGVADSFHV